MNDLEIGIFDTDSRSLIRSLKCARTVELLKLSPDGLRLVSWSDDYRTKVWNIETGECLWTRTQLGGVVSHLAWNANGSIIALAANYIDICLFDATTGATLVEIPGEELAGEEFSQKIYSIIAHPSQDLFATTFDDSIHIRKWTSGGELVRIMKGHTHAICSLETSETMLVSGSIDKTMRVWSWETGECLHVFEDLGWFDSPFSLSWRDSKMITLTRQLIPYRESLETLAISEQIVGVWNTSAASPRDWKCEKMKSLTPKSGKPRSGGATDGTVVKEMGAVMIMNDSTPVVATTVKLWAIPNSRSLHLFEI